jgi:hypothetical protein
MPDIPLSQLVKERVETASRVLGTASPLRYVGETLERAFPLPQGDARYADNSLVQDAAPILPRFNAAEPDVLRFTIEPLGPQATPVTRRHEATREMRRLVGPLYGRDALAWFDRASEEWRGMSSLSRLSYGAWLTTGYDGDGLRHSTVVYELRPGQLEGLAPALAAVVRAATEALPGLVPLFTSIACGRESGTQRVTFRHRGPLRLRDLEPLLARLGMSHQLPGLMQVVGLTLGGRFELPDGTVLVGLGESPEGPEFRLEIMLGLVPDVPPSFLDLLALGLSERPRELRALARFLRAFAPSPDERPGDVSVLSIRTTPRSSPRVGLFLRPLEFEVREAVANGETPALAHVG